MKKTVFMAISLLMLLTVSAAAIEIDMSYTGEIDSYTGQPLYGNDTVSYANVVTLSASSYYDRDRGMFVHILSNDGSKIYSSVAYGMVTNDPVSIEIPAGVDAALYYNGKELSNPDYGSINVPGSYLLSVDNGATRIQPFKFTIVNSVTGSLNEYRMPSGFAVTEVLYNGESLPVTVDVVDLSEEGDYQITYYCQPTALPYHLNVSIDHTPPTLALEAVKDGIARGPVSLADIAPGDRIYISLDGEQIGYTEELTQSGSYVINLQDEAGNVTTYKFVLQVYFNINSLVFFAIILAAVVFITVRVYRARRHLRVR